MLPGKASACLALAEQHSFEQNKGVYSLLLF